MRSSINIRLSTSMDFKARTFWERFWFSHKFLNFSSHYLICFIFFDTAFFSIAYTCFTFCTFYKACLAITHIISLSLTNFVWLVCDCFLWFSLILSKTCFVIVYIIFLLVLVLQWFVLQFVLIICTYCCIYLDRLVL